MGCHSSKKKPSKSSGEPTLEDTQIAAKRQVRERFFGLEKHSAEIIDVSEVEMVTEYERFNLQLTRNDGTTDKHENVPYSWNLEGIWLQINAWNCEHSLPKRFL